MVYHGKIYYTFGFGRADFPNGMRIFDLKQRKITGRYDFGESVLGTKRLRHVVYIMENYYVIPIKGAFMW